MFCSCSQSRRTSVELPSCNTVAVAVTDRTKKPAIQNAEKQAQHHHSIRQMNIGVSLPICPRVQGLMPVVEFQKCVYHVCVCEMGVGLCEKEWCLAAVFPLSPPHHVWLQPVFQISCAQRGSNQSSPRESGHSAQR